SRSTLMVGTQRSARVVAGVERVLGDRLRVSDGEWAGLMVDRGRARSARLVGRGTVVTALRSVGAPGGWACWVGGRPGQAVFTAHPPGVWAILSTASRARLTAAA